MSLLAPFGAPLVQEIPFPGAEGAAPPTQWKDTFRAVATQQQQAAMIVCVSVPPYQTAANDQWCDQSCNREGLKTKTCSSTICKCGGTELKLSPDGEQYEEEEEEEGELPKIRELWWGNDRRMVHLLLCDGRGVPAGRGGRL